MRTKNSTYFEIIINFIKEFQCNNGTSPTIREIAESIAIPRATVARYLAQLKADGLLTYSGHRNISKLTDSEQPIITTNLTNIPILGRIACGIPMFATENIEEYIQLPKSLLGEGDFFLLHAAGDSMIKAGINDGDLVLIRQQNVAEPGQIVVALIDEEATLKRFFPENGRIRLQPENDSLEPIFVYNCTIQGIAIKVLKDLI